MTFPARLSSYVVAGAIAAALLIYGFGQVSALLGAHDAEITAASVARLHDHAGLARYRAKLAAAEQRYAMTFAGELATADSLRQALRTGTRVDTVRVLLAIATHDSTALRACSVIVQTCAQRAASAEAEADSLAAQLKAQLAVHDRRCGLFGGAGVAAGKGTGAGLVLAVGCRLWP